MHGIAGWIEVTPNHWKDCKWDIYGKCLLQDVFGSPSGHLYEVPHVVKAAEAVTAIIQKSGKGATWMIEELYSKMTTMKKFVFDDDTLNEKLDEAELWANSTIDNLKQHQKQLPWFNK